MINLFIQTAKGSLKDSIITPEKLSVFPQSVYGIADKTLFGVADFYKYCTDNNIKPIIGLQLNVANNVGGKNLYDKFVVYAVNSDGLRQLFDIVNSINVYGLIEESNLYNKISNLLFVLYGGTSFRFLYENQMFNEYVDVVRKYQSFLGDKLYVMYDVIGIRNDFIIVLDIAVRNNIKSLYGSFVKYANSDDVDIYDIIYCLHNNISYPSNTQHNFSYIVDFNEFDVINYEFINQIGDYHEYFKSRKIKIFSFDMSVDEFRSILIQKLIDRNIHDDIHLNRLEYEINVINNMGYIDYFLLVKDIIDYANTYLHGYLSSGRGSVGGSLVAYLFGITRVDPIQPHGFVGEIPFDRFLNKNRKVMPDIDLDFYPEDRDYIVQYLKDKYGDNNVKHMPVFLTYGARSSVREIARITGVLSSIDNVIKSFPHNQSLTLDMIEKSELFVVNSDNSIFVNIFNLAKKIEDLPHTVGIHASGIAINTSGVNLPVFLHKSSGVEAYQFDQYQLENLGVLKLDILGLNTLRFVGDTMKSLDMSIDQIDRIDLNDKATYELINNCLLTGVFQWNTANYKKVIERMRPSSFKELVDLNTLGRTPALVSGLTDDYINRKNKLKATIPLHPKLNGLMGDTYELPLYQEQIMKIFMELADYSMSEADDIRRVIAKKIPSELERHKDVFTQRCLNNGLSHQDIDDIWNVIDKFSSYTWNVAHAVTYTKLCYETAYLATHYAEHYYSACINNATKSTLVSEVISTIKYRNIKYESVSINLSIKEFTVIDGRIVAGFNGLKFLKDSGIKIIIDDRNSGKYPSILAFINRCRCKYITARAIISLFVAGAFNGLPTGVIDKKDNKIWSSVFKKHLYDYILDQYSLSGRITYDLIPITKPLYNNIKYTNIRWCVDNINAISNSIYVIAYIVDLHEYHTKNNKKMAFIVLEDNTGRIDVVCFSDVWQLYDKIPKGKPFIVKLSKTNNGYSIQDFFDVELDYENTIYMP